MSLNSTFHSVRELIFIPGEEDFTVHIHQASSMSDETFRSPQEVVETDTQTNLLDDLVILIRDGLAPDSRNRLSPPCWHIWH